MCDSNDLYIKTTIGNLFNMKRIQKIIILILVCVNIIAMSGCDMNKTPEHIKVDGTKYHDEDVIIALIDTGVSTAAISSSHLLQGYNYVTDSDDTEDKINHGTAIASIILGCESAEIMANAPDAYIVPLVVVTDVDGNISQIDTDTLATVVRECVDIYKADIINISLGSTKDSPALKEAVEYAKDKGVLVVSAMGNDGDTYYPASYDTVLSVGSVDREGRISSFSSVGADVYALGEDMWLASKNGVKYGERGTSFSTGYISADAANIILDEDGISLQELKEKLRINNQPIDW